MPEEKTPQPGEAKIVKLGSDTVLVVEIKNGESVAEGKYFIRKIDVGSSEAGGAGASCFVQIN